MGILGIEKIIGYYTKSACMLGEPSSKDDVECVFVNEGENIRIIYPPFFSFPREISYFLLRKERGEIAATDTSAACPIELSLRDQEDIKLVGGFTGVGFWNSDQDLKDMQNNSGRRVFHVYGGAKLTDERLAEIITDLDKACIVSLDQEGGPVNRLGWAEGVAQISLRSLTEVRIDKPKQREYANSIGALTAEHLKAYGINLNFGPILDLHTSNRYRNISGTDPNIIASLAQSYMEGIQGKGVAYCAKHFPDTWSEGDTDQHLVRTTEPLTQFYIEERYGPLIADGLPAIMMSHLIFKGEGSPDRETPASLSRAWVNKVREEMGFEGLIVTDALAAGSIKEYMREKGLTYEDVVIQAYQAGVDLVLGDDSIEATVSILEKAVEDGKISMSQIRTSAQRIRDFSQTFPRTRPLAAEARKEKLAALEIKVRSLYEEINGRALP